MLTKYFGNDIIRLSNGQRSTGNPMHLCFFFTFDKTAYSGNWSSEVMRERSNSRGMGIIVDDIGRMTHSNFPVSSSIAFSHSMHVMLVIETNI